MAKGKKEGSTQQKFMVAISYNHDVVLCENYEELNRSQYADMVRKFFPLAFSVSVNPKLKRILQEGCPVQNSRKAKRALENLGDMYFAFRQGARMLILLKTFFTLLERKFASKHLIKK